MNEKYISIIVDWLIKYDAIKETDKELYCYAMYSFLISLSPLLLAIGFGLCMGAVKQSIMIVLPFMLIRKFSGGYHTSDLKSCLLCSGLLLLLCMILSFYIKCGWALAFVTAASAVSLIIFSPIDSKNRVLNQKETTRYKKITTTIVAMFLLLNIVFFLMGLYTYTICTSISIILSAGLQIPCILKDLIIK